MLSWLDTTTLLVVTGVLASVAISAIAYSRRQEILRRGRRAAAGAGMAFELDWEEWRPSLVGIPLVLGGMLLLLYTISVEWPKFTAGYSAQGGPPWWTILLFVAFGTAIVKWASPRGRLMGYGVIAFLMLLIVIASIRSMSYGTDLTRGEDEAAQRRAQALIEQQAAIASATRPNSVSWKCDSKTEWPFRYELHFKEVPEQENCGATFKMKDNRTYEVRYRDGHTTVLRDGPGKTIVIDPFAKEVRAVDEAFDAYIVLYPPQRR